MSRNKITFIAALAMVMIAIAIVANSQEPTRPASPSQTYGAESPAFGPEAGESWMEVEETWTFAEEPQDHMQAAHESFLKKDVEGAAREIRNAAEIIIRVADDAADVSKELLEGSANELKRMAEDIGYGTIDSVEALDHAFARAYHALAMYYHDVAFTSFASRELRRAGHALGASVKAFEYAVEWSGRTLETGAKMTIDGALAFSGKLIEGTGFATKEAGKIVADVGYEVERFGNAIDPYSKN